MVGLDKAVALPTGLESTVQLYVSGSPLGSELALPFNVMTVPERMLPRSGPALAAGAPLGVDTLLESPQPFSARAARSEKRTVHTMFRWEGWWRIGQPHLRGGYYLGCLSARLKSSSLHAWDHSSRDPRSLSTLQEAWFTLLWRGIRGCLTP